MFPKIVTVLLIFCVASFISLAFADPKWPIPYKRFSHRPINNPFCQAKYTFCPTGIDANMLPSFDNDDVIDVFALKAPVWEFKYGNLLKFFNIMHDAIGFRSHKTNINYTVEWYELDQLFNCTFPHVLNNTELTWCNQGASCFYQGIDDAHWSENGTLVKVAQMTGSQFKNYTDYLLWDNKTGIYYETWTVIDKIDGTTWFEPHDCATFVINSFKKMGEIGVQFNKSISLSYSMIIIFSETPTLLGNVTVIKTMPALYKKIVNFYHWFQRPRSVLGALDQALHVLFTFFVQREFYLFYNYEYWNLHLRYPFLKLVYKQIPLP